MIKQNREVTKIEGRRDVIVCEFSAIVLALLQCGIKKDEIDWAMTQAFDYYEKDENKIEEEHEDSKERLKENFKKLDEIGKELSKMLKEAIENEDN